jgi:mRNA-degrading endonuclease RelE of RelBE toxin-antitoxin system
MPDDDEGSPGSPVRYAPEFKRNLRILARKYRSIKSDLESLLGDLAAGGTPGDQVPGVGVDVFKVRLANSDSRKGKSGGYRVIFLKAEDVVVLITIYSKNEQEDISANEIRDLILEAEAEPPAAADANGS